MQTSSFLARIAVLVSALCVAATSFADEGIAVGRSLALTGALKAYGEAKRDGGDAYIEKINKAGGVAGRRINLVTLDDAYQPAKTVENLRQLTDKNAPSAFLGLFGVPTVAAALPELLKLKIPAVGLTSGMAQVRTPHNPYAFPVRASYADEAHKLVAQIKTIGVSKISVIYTDNPFGEGVKDSLLEALRKEGLTALAVKVNASGTLAAKAIAQAVATEPQAVFLAMLSQAAVPVLVELKKNNFHAQLYTFSPVDTTVILQALGKDASGLGISQVVPIPQGSRLPIVVEYTEALKVLGRGTPSFYGLEAFIEAKILVEALRRAGSAAANPAAVLKALETLRTYDVGGYVVSYGPGVRTGSSFVEVDIIDSQGVLRR